MITGGTLTDESWTDLKSILQDARGIANYHEPLILEASADNLDLNASGGSTKLEVLDWTKFREKDIMFEKYGESTKGNVRNVYRFPPVYIGDLGSYSFASLYASRESGEEQIFVPERRSFDEIINNQIMPALGIMNWTYRSRGPQIRGSEETRKAIDVFSRAGALTVNHAIRMANEAFGLQMSTFEEAWANYPIPIIMKMVEQGSLAGLGAIMSQIQENPLPKKAVIPEELEKSDAFSPDQKKLYRYLSGLMHLVGAEEHEDVD
jgi:capsid portal protein